MPLIPSSGFRSGKPFVRVEVKGVSETALSLARKGKSVSDGSDLAMFQGANLIQQEVQESIIGNRDEPKSVDTGNFANSIDVDKIIDSAYIVFTMVPYSVHLEEGTEHIPARKHFHNTIERNRGKVIGTTGLIVRNNLAKTR